MTVPIQVEIDPAGRGVLIAAGDRWSFDLDLATRTALLASGPGDETIRVRELRWREKLTVARFAALGEAFMDRAVAMTCASERSPSAPDDAVVAAFVAWLEDPRGSDVGQPGGLDSERLAGVTVALCRLTGLRPADIDELPAGDVAQLWAAAQAGGYEADEEVRVRPALADDDWADTATRIVVIDDEPSTPSEGTIRMDDLATGAEAGRGAAVEPADIDAPTEPDPPGARTPGPSAGRGGENARLMASRAKPGRRAGDRSPAVALRRATSDPPIMVALGAKNPPVPAIPHAASEGSEAAGPPGSPASAAPAASSALAGEQPVDIPAPSNARLTPAGRPVADDRGPTRPVPRLPAATGPGQKHVRESTRAGATRMKSQGRTATRPVVPPDIERVAAESTWLGGATAAVPAHQLAPRSVAVAPPSRRVDPSTGTGLATADVDTRPATLDRSQRESLFQALADELERATAELGIGSEA